MTRYRKKVNETEITKAIRDVLRCFGVYHWKQHQGLGSFPGVSDILGIYKGRMLAIEVKAPGRRVQPGSAQERFLANIHEQGGIAIEADSIDALVLGFARYGIELPVLCRLNYV